MSKYFTDDELKCKCCGQLPAAGMVQSLLNLIDAIREKIGKPIKLSCAFRCPSHNAEVGGVPDSQHVQGCAADIPIPDGMTVEELATIAEECGADGIGRYENDQFVHVDTRGSAARWNG